MRIPNLYMKHTNNRPNHYEQIALLVLCMHALASSRRKDLSKSKWVYTVFQAISRILLRAKELCLPELQGFTSSLKQPFRELHNKLLFEI
jgi:hypothetical protein